MENKYKSKISIIKIIAWIIIASLIAIAIWLLSGSPTNTGAIIGIIGFVSASEILLWKYLFNIEKNTQFGFAKVKYDLEMLKKDIDIKFNTVNTKLDKLLNKK